MIREEILYISSPIGEIDKEKEPSSQGRMHV